MNFEEDRFANAHRAESWTDMRRISRLQVALPHRSFVHPKIVPNAQSHRSRRPISVLPPLRGSARAVSGLLRFSQGAA